MSSLFAGRAERDATLRPPDEALAVLSGPYTGEASTVKRSVARPVDSRACENTAGAATWQRATIYFFNESGWCEESKAGKRMLVVGHVAIEKDGVVDAADM